MKQLLLFFLIFQIIDTMFAQSDNQLSLSKPALDTSVFGKWPSVEVPILTTDAQYALFVIKNQPLGSNTLVLRSITKGWKKQFIGAKGGAFTSDNQRALFLTEKDSLCITLLGNQQMEYIPKVSAYKLIKQGRDEWLVYQLKGFEKKLVIRNVNTGTQKVYERVLNYLFSEDGSVLLLQRESVDQSGQQVSWINFTRGDSIDIWQGKGAYGFVFDNTNSQIAFTVSDSEENNWIWYYKRGTDKAILLAASDSKGIDSNLVLGGVSYYGFSKDGTKLFIELKEKPYAKPKQGAVMVDVWSYLDVKMQSRQLEELKEGPKKFLAIINIETHNITRLQQENDLYSFILPQVQNSIIVQHMLGGLPEEMWNSIAVESNNYFIALINGERKKLSIQFENSATSPSGSYLLGEVRKDSFNIFSYNILTGKYRCITRLIPGGKDEKYESDETRLSFGKSLIVLDWLINEKWVLIRDHYDLWLTDPQAEKRPINITNGYGRRNHIIFNLPEVYKHKLISEKDEIILQAFNQINKTESFYKVRIGESSNPQLLTTGNYKYKIPNTTFNSLQIAASTNNSFLVSRENSHESTNYFLTSDFKVFIPVTDNYPESNFNWLSGELHTWKSLDGHILQGVLYKPENFNPKNRYPVIIHYYQKMSDNLNEYKFPDATVAHLNIAWFVSNGYLVFTPDIYFKVGHTGESAYNSVISATKYLSKYSWVDAKHIGLQGQSFGGYLTNYIVSRSNLFAAAMSSSGMSDIISGYGGISWGGVSAQEYFETGQGRIKSTLWEHPDLYIKGSPILFADKVKTPLLMMNNKKDEFGYPQGIEFFTALRRLGKRVWLLQYDNGGHTVRLSKDAMQHTIRMTQFFDHYLKGKPAPMWMTRGIPAKMKGIDDGLKLDNEIKTPGQGLLFHK